METKTKRGTVREWPYSWGDDFRVSLKYFIGKLQEILDEIPAEFRDSAVIEFDTTGSDYEYSRGEMYVEYDRPETDEEVRQREDDARKREEEKQQSERRQYETLKRKYEAP